MGEVEHADCPDRNARARSAAQSAAEAVDARAARHPLEASGLLDHESLELVEGELIRFSDCAL